MASKLFPPTNMDEAVEIAAHGAAALPALKRTPRQKAPIAKACVRALRMIGGPKAFALLQQYADDGRVRDELVSAWGSFDRAEFAREIVRRMPEELALSSLDSLEGIGELAGHVTELSIAQSRGLQALAPLRALADPPKLRSLNLWRLPKVRDLSALGALTSLEELQIEGAPAVEDLSSLSQLKKLTRLMLRSLPKVTDLSVLASLPKLGSVVLGAMPQVSTLEPLARIRPLKDLLLDELGVDLEVPERFRSPPFNSHEGHGSFLRFQRYD